MKDWKIFRNFSFYFVAGENWLKMTIQWFHSDTYPGGLSSYQITSNPKKLRTDYMFVLFHKLILYYPIFAYIVIFFWWLHYVIIIYILIYGITILLCIFIGPISCLINSNFFLRHNLLISYISFKSCNSLSHFTLICKF